MSRISYIWLAVTALFLTLQPELAAQSSIEKIASDRINIIIDSSDNEGISILQLTDLHLGGKGKWKDDSTTFRRIKRLVEMYNPDLLALTGDVFSGKKMAALVVRHFDELQCPWLYVFGNHDAEGDIDRDGIYDVFSESLWGILGYHRDSSPDGRKYDYCVNIVLKGEAIPRWQIYGLDTGPHEGVKAIQPGQIEWYKDRSQASMDEYGTMPRAISIFHIPFIQYQYLWDDKSIHKEGESREKVWYEEDDGSTYKAFLKVGNIEATFCGHDHYNNYWGCYTGGIILSYGYISGEATNEAWPTGGKLINLPLDSREIQIQNVVPVFDCEISRNIEKTLAKFHDANSDYVMVAAHRAAHKLHPENSISAIKHAIELGVDIVELDVKTTKDGIPVLMHDGTVDRTTNGTGKVKDYTLAELKALSLKMPDGTITEETIPTFEEALRVIHGNIMVDIDLKTDNVRPIVGAVERTGTNSQVFYFDNDYDLLNEILDLEESSMIMPRAYSYEMADSALKRFSPQVVHIDPSFYTPEVGKLIANGNARIWINALGIPDAMIRKGDIDKAMSNLLQYKANIIQTDEPELLLNYLRKIPESIALRKGYYHIAQKYFQKGGAFMKLK